MNKRNIDKLLKQNNPQTLLKEVMDSDEVSRIQKMGQRVEDAINTLSEEIGIINDNLLTYVDYFKEIDDRLKAIEKNTQTANKHVVIDNE